MALSEIPKKRRVVLRAGEFDDEMLAALARTEVASKYAYLDHLDGLAEETPPPKPK